MDSRPSCLALFATWLLAILMVTVIGIYGIAGLFPSLILLLVGQRIRGEHDRISAQRILQSQRWKAFFVAYYLLILGPIVVYSAIEHIYLSRLPVALFILMIGFPVVIAALVNDVTSCQKSKGKGDQKDNRSIF